jgi:hypothetical protein
MNGGTKAGFSTISLERLKGARRDSASSTERRRRKGTGVKQLLSKLPEVFVFVTSFS